MKYKLNIAWLYPDLMSTYGDRGNIIVLEKRCLWRGIGIKTVSVSIETSVNMLENCDLIFMGGAQDRQQKIAGNDFLSKKAPVLKRMIDRGIPGLFVCAAYQTMGHYYRPFTGKDILGASVFDLITIHMGDQKKRLIGNTYIEVLNPSECRGKYAVGFENHGGRTILGKGLKPFAKVLKGYGNNGDDGYEGAVYQNAIGSYLHGPILPKNVFLADFLIRKALEMKYGKKISLKKLDDGIEDKAKNKAVSIALG